MTSRVLLTVVAALVVECWSSPADAQRLRLIPTTASYSTTFAATENPLAEGGTGWVNGLADGLDWEDFQVTPNGATGTQTEGQHGNSNGTPYNDSIACKKPPVGQRWSDDQDVRGRVFITSRTGWTGFHEVELWARCSITPNWARGYEAIFSVVGGTTYFEIVRWNGPLGQDDCTLNCAFTSLNNVSCTGVNDGTYVRFTAVGSTLTQYTSSNGTDWAIACSDSATVTDSTWKEGMPGMGHWTNGNGDPANYGFSQWSAQ